MKRQFVAVMDTDSTAAFNAMVEMFKTLPRVGWCKYMKGLWQIIDVEGVLTAGDLRGQIREALPADTMVIVFEIKPGSDWSGWVPPKMAKWIKNNWE
jgi:hypothetical protein